MKQRIILTVACLAIFFETLDVSVLNMAIPQMELYFSAGPDGIQWVQTVYVLCYAGFVLLGGRLADTNGRRRIFVSGALLFAAASLAAGFSVSFAWLLTCRAFQGIGVAMAIPAAIAIITNTFPNPVERNRALGVFGAMAGIGFATGLATGGIISKVLGWQWVFFINVPVIAVAVILALRYIPADERNKRTSRNIWSGVMIAILMLLASWLIHSIGSIGRNPLLFGILLAVSGILGYYFVKRESVHPSPLVDFKLFRLPGVITGNLGAFLSGSVFLSYIFLLTLYLQQELHFSSATAGLLLFPFSILSGLTSKYLLPRLLQRFGVVKTGIIGNSFMLSGILFFLLSNYMGHSLVFLFFAVLCLNSVGISIIYPCVTILSVQSTPEAQHGLASGISATSGSFGNGMGLSVIGVVMRLCEQQHWNIYGAGLITLTILAVLAIVPLISFCYLRPEAPEAL
ncbi:MFS transporter [Chitinophaga vietnamensis]|uniref:MFS transporter n=1 Tax=Chitinophaga vietnamensis TaxID=2593957 RepID=UPI00137551E7|nr:MFS transporter [Chitinophaga vietnamensis]